MVCKVCHVRPAWLKGCCRPCGEAMGEQVYQRVKHELEALERNQQSQQPYCEQCGHGPLVLLIPGDHIYHCARCGHNTLHPAWHGMSVAQQLPGGN